MTAQPADEIVTPRALALTLRSAENPSKELAVRRHEPLFVTGRVGGGFVELDYGGARWLADERALEPWRGGEETSFRPAASAAPSPAPPRAFGAAPAFSPSALGASADPFALAPRMPAGYPPAPLNPPGYGADLVAAHGGPPARGRELAAPGYCPAGGRTWGNARACQFCRQVDGAPIGVRVSSPGKRLAAYVLDFIICVLTRGIGWVIWTIIVAAKGQSPGKQILGMKVVHLSDSGAASWGRMFLREMIAKAVIAIGVFITFGLGAIVYFWLLWDKDDQQLWDKMVNTVVVNDPGGQL